MMLGKSCERQVSGQRRWWGEWQGTHVLALEREVLRIGVSDSKQGGRNKATHLDNDVDHVVGVLDPRDGHVANVLGDGGQDDLAHVVPELRLELVLCTRVHQLRSDDSLLQIDARCPRCP